MVTCIAYQLLVTIYRLHNNNNELAYLASVALYAMAMKFIYFPYLNFIHISGIINSYLDNKFIGTVSKDLCFFPTKVQL